MPDFNRDVRPILSKACFRCHGTDVKQRKAKLRLDIRDEAISKNALVPGDPNASELMFRILSHDPEKMMPPPEKGERLSPEQIAVLSRWIEGDAPYANHWAFIKPERPVLPSTEGDKSPIDQLLGTGLKKQGLTFADAAEKEVWLRRVYFDLTGLPPTIASIEAFVADTSKNAREKVVDQLLNSRHFGERMAQGWLDLARYADTYGRHEDADCVTWPYRDWVINAFNTNLPYDEFVTWQTAGDLLPNPTRDQMVATCFNRLPQQSNEAGSNPEEFRIEQVADRVKTNATTFLGLTMQCARCHDHKYDPLSQKEYYSMSAFFNNIDELGLFAVYTAGIPTPSILLYDEPQQKQLEEIHTKLAALEIKKSEVHEAAKGRFETWLKENSPPMQPSSGLWSKVGNFFTGPPPTAVEATQPLVWLKFEEHKKDKKYKNEVSEERYASLHRHTPIVEGRLGNAFKWEGDNGMLVENFDEVRRTQPFSMAVWLKPLQKFDRAYFYDRELTDPEISQIALLPDHSKTKDWFAWYLREIDEESIQIEKSIKSLRDEDNELSALPTELMVMQTKPGEPRKTHVLNRGQFDQPLEEVQPATPASLSPFPDDFPLNRLGFAKWLVSPENPLTARVAVNRLWQHFFERGLVGTSEDFGTQGEYPKYPQLLDWLAVHFQEDLSWNVKELCREITLSEAYGQSSVPKNPSLLVDDPDNRLIARGPRARLQAENLRDMALFVSGLLVDKVGGPSVKPYQPANLWEDSGTQHSYTQGHNEDLYRRSLYTFWRRTLPPPSMTIFDAPTREYCSTRRTPTATPLQALVLINDPQFIEAARVLAEELVQKYPRDHTARIEEAFRRLTSREPDPEQVASMLDYMDSEFVADHSQPKIVKAFLEGSGEHSLNSTLPSDEVAGTAKMIRMLFGFSETQMKP